MSNFTRPASEHSKSMKKRAISQRASVKPNIYEEPEPKRFKLVKQEEEEYEKMELEAASQELRARAKMENSVPSWMKESLRRYKVIDTPINPPQGNPEPENAKKDESAPDNTEEEKCNPSLCKCTGPCKCTSGNQCGCLVGVGKKCGNQCSFCRKFCGSINICYNKKGQPCCTFRCECLHCKASAILYK